MRPSQPVRVRPRLRRGWLSQRCRRNLRHGPRKHHRGFQEGRRAEQPVLPRRGRLRVQAEIGVYRGAGAGRQLRRRAQAPRGGAER